MMKFYQTLVCMLFVFIAFGQCPNNAVLTQTPAVICIGDSVTLEITNITPNTTVVWDDWTNGYNTTVLTGPKIKVKYTGPQFRAVINSISGCTQFRYTALQAALAPSISYGAGDTVCGGGFNLSLTSNGTNFAWTFSNPDTSGAVLSGMNGLTIGNGGKTLVSVADPFWSGKHTVFTCTVTGTQACPNKATFPVTVYAPRTDTVIVAPLICVGDTIRLIGNIKQAPFGAPVWKTSWNFLPDTTDLFIKFGSSSDTLVTILPNDNQQQIRFKNYFVCDNSAQSALVDTVTLVPGFCGSQSQNKPLQTMVNGLIRQSKDSLVLCFGTPFTITGTTTIGNSIRIINASGNQYNGGNIFTRSQVMSGASGWWRVQARNGNTVLKTDSIFIGIRSVPAATIAAPTTYCVGDTLTLSVTTSTQFSAGDWYYETTKLPVSGSPALITFAGSGAYRTTITDSLGCTKTVSQQINKGNTPNWHTVGGGGSNNYHCCGYLTKTVNPVSPADSVGATYQWYHIDSVGNSVPIQNGTGQFPTTQITGAQSNQLFVSGTGLCGTSAWIGPQTDYCIVTIPGKCPWRSQNILTTGIVTVTTNPIVVPTVDTICVNEPITLTASAQTHQYQTGYFGFVWAVNDSILFMEPANSTNQSTFTWVPQYAAANNLVVCRIITNYCAIGEQSGIFLKTDSCSIPEVITYCDTLIVHDTVFVPDSIPYPVVVIDSFPVPFVVIDTLLVPDSIPYPVLVHDTTIITDTLIIFDPVPIVIIDTFLIYDTVPVLVHDTVPIIVRDSVPFIVRDTVLMGCKTDSFYILTTIVLRDTILDTIPVGCQIGLYPNPTVDNLTVYPPDPDILKYDVYIYSMNG
jgi:hypothetical protein